MINPVHPSLIFIAAALALPLLRVKFLKQALLLAAPLIALADLLSLSVQLNLLEEVKGLIDVPLVVVSNKSDITAAGGYLTMSTQTGDGVDAVLAEILLHKPEPVARVKDIVPDIRSPLPHEPEERVRDELPYPEEEGRHERKPKPRRARKPRTVVSPDRY